MLFITPVTLSRFVVELITVTRSFMSSVWLKTRRSVWRPAGVHATSFRMVGMVLWNSSTSATTSDICSMMERNFSSLSRSRISACLRSVRSVKMVKARKGSV